MIEKIKNKFIEWSDPQIRAIRGQKLSYLTPSHLRDLRDCVLDIEQQKIEGMFLEAGCALGGSAIYISKFKAKNRTFRVYDMFGMIPPPSDRDTEAEVNRYKVIAEGKSKGIEGDEYYGYKKDLLAEVKKNFTAFGVDYENEEISFIKGDFHDTMKIEAPVAFAHIDCDWYDSVYFSLQQIVPNLSQGGIIILDDYFHWPSCKQATEDFLSKENHTLKKVAKSKMYLINS